MVTRYNEADIDGLAQDCSISSALALSRRYNPATVETREIWGIW